MGRQVQVDLARVSRLEDLLGAKLSEILASLLRSMAAQIETIEQALAAARPEDAVQPAHLCRNDALMVGAEPLLAALTDVESAGRSNRLEPARAALARLQSIWPATRDELERIARLAGSA
jgi:HPt (histidine-containing phosphotransfer) domain-containing protein